MAIDLRNHKLDRAFGHMDLDANGFIERDDLLGLGARILVGFGESPTSGVGRQLVDGFDGIWATLAHEIDRNRDDRISAEEFRTGMTSAFIEGDHYEPVFEPASRAVAELCDADRDGQIGPAEFRIMLSAFGTAYDDVDAAFDRLDRDVKGRLTVEDLVEATRQYYTGDDPHAAGNWLYGPL